MNISVKDNLWLRIFLWGWQGNNICKVFKPQSCQKKMAMNITDRGEAIHISLGNFALTTSGRLRVVSVSPLTLRHFQIWLSKATHPPNKFFNSLSCKSFLQGTEASCLKAFFGKNCQSPVQTPPGQQKCCTERWGSMAMSTHHHKSVQLTKYHPKHLRSKNAQIFWVPKFKLKNCSWQSRSARFAQAGILV